jgi:hypothetical protein
MLERGNDFSITATSSNDNNVLYFCGIVNNDFFYGYLDSKDVANFNNDTTNTGGANSAKDLIQVKKIYKYGSTASEMYGDCALSEDNKYLYALFSTNFK